MRPELQNGATFEVNSTFLGTRSSASFTSMNVANWNIPCERQASVVRTSMESRTKSTGFLKALWQQWPYLDISFSYLVSQFVQNAGVGKKQEFGLTIQMPTAQIKSVWVSWAFPAPLQIQLPVSGFLLPASCFNFHCIIFLTHSTKWKELQGTNLGNIKRHEKICCFYFNCFLSPVVFN